MQTTNKWNDLMNYMVIIDTARKLNSLLDFPNKEVGTTSMQMPRKEDVDTLLQNADRFDEDEMIPQEYWTGGCFKTLFDGLIKELAEKEEVDQWDYFACFLHKLFE